MQCLIVNSLELCGSDDFFTNAVPEMPCDPSVEQDSNYSDDYLMICGGINSNPHYGARDFKVFNTARVILD